MIIVSLFLIGVAVVLLLFGLREPSTALLSASIGTSLLAALLLVISARRPAGAHDEYAMEWQPRHAGDASRAMAASSEQTMRMLDLASGASTSDRGAPTGPVMPAAAGRDHGVPGRRRTEDAGLSYPGIGAVSQPARSGAATLSPDPEPADEASPADLPVPQQGGLTVEVADEVSDPDTRLADGGETVGDRAAAEDRSLGDGPAEDRPAGDGPAEDRSLGDGPAEDRSLGDGPAGDLAADEELYLADEPTVQQVSSADAARVSRLSTEVLVVDGRPRYHLSGCVHLLGRDSEPLPVSEAVELGFTPCGLCEPDSALLADARRV